MSTRKDKGLFQDMFRGGIKEDSVALFIARSTLVIDQSHMPATYYSIILIIVNSARTIAQV